MDEHTINDPVFGVLSWDEHGQMWRGQVLFTPKHPVSLVYLGPREGANEEELGHCGVVYWQHRQHEWEYRLDIAEALIEVAEREPIIAEEIESLKDIAAVARRLILAEIEFDPGAEDTWLYYFDRTDGMHIDLYLNADGISSIEF